MHNDVGHETHEVLECRRLVCCLERAVKDRPFRVAHDGAQLVIEANSRGKVGCSSLSRLNVEAVVGTLQKLLFAPEESGFRFVRRSDRIGAKCLTIPAFIAERIDMKYLRSVLKSFSDRE